MIRELTCIGCPMGCNVSVEIEDGEIKNVSGYTCRRGLTYATNEVTHPMRTVTSSVKVTGNAHMQMVSVKTESDIPKDKIFDVVKSLKDISVASPVHIGDVVCENVCGLGVNVIATKNA